MSLFELYFYKACRFINHGDEEHTIVSELLVNALYRGLRFYVEVTLIPVAYDENDAK